MNLKKVSKEPFYKYAEDILSGKIQSGKYVKLAVERFFSDLDKGDYKFDYAKGKRVVEAARLFSHWKGDYSGKPIIFEPNQEFYIIQQFGWLKDNGLRRFRRCYKKVARGNGKTTEEAFKANYLISKDGEQGAQVYCGATKEAQALILVNDAGKMIEKSPKVRKHFKLLSYAGKYNKVICPSTSGFIAPLGRDSKTDDGFDPYAAMIDEYHAHKDNGTRNVLESGMVKRSQPITDIITTAGSNIGGVCYRFEQMCKNILDGSMEDDSLLAMIYDLDNEDLLDDNWQNEELWIKSNPNLGISVNLDEMRATLKTALNERGMQIGNFKTKNLNIWINAIDTWIEDDIWMKNSDDPQPCEIYFSGLDIAVKRDWSAYLLIGQSEDGFYNVIPYFWIPKELVADKVKNENSNLLDWIEQGLVFTTPGNVTDHDAVADFILEKRTEVTINNCLADEAYCISIINQLNKGGLETLGLPQTPTRLTQPTTLLYELVMEGKLRHGGNPVLRWMMGNAVLKEYGSGLCKIEKENTLGKIDGIDALINSLVPFTIPVEENNLRFDLW
jgi:phage terminase large subunit-like protein